MTELGAANERGGEIDNNNKYDLLPSQGWWRCLCPQIHVLSPLCPRRPVMRMFHRNNNQFIQTAWRKYIISFGVSKLYFNCTNCKKNPLMSDIISFYIAVSRNAIIM